ncbi:tRNA lysidine(34) synthetase TilS [Aurantibacter crassamenti]|uniref:tRNA lysidine(34) synthetase TilS n=1 Tax=Aurantibacter crassamenti TaxID=1837375 RepID=UPI0019398518|nr:tRNA lysidine(34) synthetase TilS [Aurantibacter crassamenti]MBM1107294.1 tRNA lysidine(34) synthetase TilS [Aurantibacter crassamenti]
MLANFKKHLQDNFAFLKDDTFLLAISGGIDSVVLAYLMYKSDLKFAMAHCNFQMRGEESNKDEILVRELADKFNCKIHITNFDTVSYSELNKVSIQMAARELRYPWFEEIVNEFGYKTVVTAHHADDNIETFLINLSRGTGLEGLTGMPESTDAILRPLLIFSREEIAAYANSEDLIWREDASNADTKYLRNKIRHELLPTLKTLHPTFESNFKNTLEHLKGSAAIIQNHITELKKTLFIEKEGVYHISIQELKRLQPLEAYIYELFKDYDFTSYQDICSLISALSGKEVYSKTHRLLKDRDYLLLQKIKPVEHQIYRIEENTNEIYHPIKLTVQTTENVEISNDSNILFVDKKTLKYPLLLRKRQEGDYFYPLGMKGKKKVSKFFKDEKMDMISKEKQWLLYSDNKLVWIIGRRADERFKVTDTTTTILKFTVH